MGTKNTLKDLTGQTFQQLTVVKRGENSTRGKTRWVCKCTCGNEVLVPSTNLKKQKSCGCVIKQQLRERNTTHAMSKSPEFRPTYQTWLNMRDRVLNPKNENFHRYGGRGIGICAEWKNSFVSFFNDMGKRPEGKTLDRIDTDKNYCKENCKWSTPKEQAENKSKF